MAKPTRAAAGNQAGVQGPLPPTLPPMHSPTCSLACPPFRAGLGGQEVEEGKQCWGHLQPPRADHPLWPLPSWQGCPARFQPSSLPSRPLMGLRASRQLPDTAGQAFHGERRRRGRLSGFCGASGPPSTGHQSLTGARWRPRGPGTGKRRPPRSRTQARPKGPTHRR